MDKRDLFKEDGIAPEALSETTNGDADSIVMNSAWQSPKFFEAQPTVDSADEKSGLACTGAADSSSTQGSFQTLLTACTIWVQVSALSAPRLTPVC